MFHLRWCLPKAPRPPQEDVHGALLVVGCPDGDIPKPVAIDVSQACHGEPEPGLSFGTWTQEETKH